MIKVLMVHTERAYFAGAERVLGYFAEGSSVNSGLRLGLAYAPGGKMDQVAKLFPDRFEIGDGARQGPMNLCANAWRLSGVVRRFKPDVIHAWAARDWELAVLVGRICGLPVVATLHDHPQAVFHSKRRRMLMRWSARAGIQRLVCVSDAVRRECVASGYRRDRLVVVRNGIPPTVLAGRTDNQDIVLGFLGVFSKRKGFPVFFELINELSRQLPDGWRVRIAGGAADPASESTLREIRAKYGSASWWSRVEFLGWTDQVTGFLSSVDLLVVPSAEFDPYPTVLLEAAWASVPVLAANVGGVPEIVVPGETGCLFDPNELSGAVKVLLRMLDREVLKSMAGFARARAERVFDVLGMVESYRSVYHEVSAGRES